MDVDVVPVVETARDLVVGCRLGRSQLVHGRIREDHAEAEGVVRPVSLEH
jgi:hypothetical protein